MNNINFVKGFFILLIVLGHDYQITSQVEGLFQFLYRFHVHAFLLLPFIFPIKSTSFSFIVDRAFRYLVPYLFFLVLSSVFFLILKGGVLFDFINNLVLAIFMSTPYFIKESSGFQLYWFLPALFSLTALRFLAVKHNVFVLFVCVIVLLTPTSFLGDYYRYIPFCLIISMYIYPMGILSSFLYNHRRNNIVAMLSVIGFLISSYYLHIENVSINISVYRFGTVLNPLDFIAVLLCPITGFISIFYLSEWIFKFSSIIHKLVCNIGSYSLIIYLVHPLFLQFFYKLLEYIFKYDPIFDANLTTRIVGFLLAILVPIILMKFLIVKFNIKNYIFPKGRFVKT
ncbi:acyltransferase family protein [Colwellia sp. Bg11-12]|uniref:acyltransferase family protein n=1 Tax=Colwellia sp. Bg11-12 TaxID=2759817 RepID=UPI0015F637B5|nr:acyltransferase family protein [Colwellia sp. Bg11-12]MBA6264779.1 acyltransferase family protein [Colwellia sp. Bg11-12]